MKVGHALTRIILTTKHDKK